MRFIFKCARYPSDPGLLIGINAAATRLSRKLRDLKVSSLEISDYNKNVLGHLCNPMSLRASLQKYGFLLAWSLAGRNIPRESFVFVDYGGGAGLLSLLASEMGVGTVIYTDIYDVSCADARVIGQAVGVEARYYVQGDAEDLATFLRDASLPCNAVTSYDVIEHVYDIEKFFSSLFRLPGEGLRLVIASSANAHNPVIKRKRMRTQVDLEHRDREPKWGQKQRDCQRAYRSARRDIIAAAAPGLLPAQMEMLVKATRGLMAQDIEQCVEAYVEAGQIARMPEHPTNTCDPYTGNWAERLMDFSYLRNVLHASEFTAQISPGYYGSRPNGKEPVRILLNAIIRIMKRQGLLLAPFYLLRADRQDS